VAGLGHRAIGLADEPAAAARDPVVQPVAPAAGQRAPGDAERADAADLSQDFNDSVGLVAQRAVGRPDGHRAHRRLADDGLREQGARGLALERREAQALVVVEPEQLLDAAVAERAVAVEEYNGSVAGKGGDWRFWICHRGARRLVRFAMKLGIVSGTSINRSALLASWEPARVETEYGAVALRRSGDLFALNR